MAPNQNNMIIRRCLSSLHETIDSFFRITERGSDAWTEFRAGTASFLTLSYLLLVNPQIMSQAGLDYGDAVVATALSSAVSSLIVGVGGNLPFGLAPGLGLSAYLAYGLVMAGQASLIEAMTSGFASGLLLLVCVFSGLTNIIMRVVPRSIKLAIVVGMGVLIAMIGMVSVKLVVGNPETLVELGDLTDLRLVICLVGIILVGSLVYHNVKGGILIGIIVLTLIFWQIDGSYPSEVLRAPSLNGKMGELIDMRVLVDLERATIIYPVIGAFLFICIFDISGVMFGLSTLAGLLQENDTVPNSVWAFIGSVAGTAIAAMIGSTPIIVTVECAAGIKEGGRTGLTAVVIALYFLAALFLSPLFGSVPAEATAPVLVLVGAMMMGESAKINWEQMDDALPAFLTIVLMPLTYSITNGMVFGLVAAAAFYLTTGKALKQARTACSSATNGEGGILLSTETPEDNRESAKFLSKRDQGRIQEAVNQANGTATQEDGSYGSMSA